MIATMEKALDKFFSFCAWGLIATVFVMNMWFFGCIGYAAVTVFKNWLQG